MAVSGEVILEAARQRMVAHVVFAYNLKIFRTPILELDIEVLLGLTPQATRTFTATQKIKIHLC